MKSSVTSSSTALVEPLASCMMLPTIRKPVRSQQDSPENCLCCFTFVEMCWLGGGGGWGHRHRQGRGGRGGRGRGGRGRGGGGGGDGGLSSRGGRSGG